jgi:hypothetical protein
MNAGTKLSLFGASLVGVFAASFGVGTAAEPVGLSNAEPVEHSGAMDDGDGLPGLATATSDFTLVPETDTFPTGGSEIYTFQIVGEDGVVTDFDVEHTKRMHLIVVRRDFTGFVHVHPMMSEDGTWTTDLELGDPGAYRVFADFVVDGDKHTLGTDLFAAGDFEPRPVPAPAGTADAGDSYEVDLAGDVIAGEESTLRFTIRANGRTLTDIPDYLGAKGHLVALRDGDLAYLHVHADEQELLFEADFPTPGQYRLFLQFEHDGHVRTAAFTVDAQETTR